MTTRSDHTLVRDLRELVAALDRRAPRLERQAEPDIARDAQRLRLAALKMIGDLERRPPAATASAAVVEETA